MVHPLRTGVMTYLLSHLKWPCDTFGFNVQRPSLSGGSMAEVHGDTSNTGRLLVPTVGRLPNRKLLKLATSPAVEDLAYWSVLKGVSQGMKMPWTPWKSETLGFSVRGTWEVTDGLGWQALLQQATSETGHGFLAFLFDHCPSELNLHLQWCFPMFSHRFLWFSQLQV